jgi:hypothetical protein
MSLRAKRGNLVVIYGANALRRGCFVVPPYNDVVISH